MDPFHSGRAASEGAVRPGGTSKSIAFRSEAGMLVHVRFARARAEDVPQSLEAELSPQERERAARFRFQADRASYTAAHVLLRRALSELHTTVQPREWTFREGELGRPELAGPEVRGFCVSLSHTRGLAACAVAQGRDVGVDVESSLRPAPLELVETCLSDRERAEFAVLPVGERQERFFFLWTLKEAYVKACGFGLRRPLRLIEVLGSDTGSIEVVTPASWSEPKGWHLESHALEGGFRLAVCVAGADIAAGQVVVEEGPPWESTGA